jgi:hypothetical protein
MLFEAICFFLSFFFAQMKEDSLQRTKPTLIRAPGHGNKNRGSVPETNYQLIKRQEGGIKFHRIERSKRYAFRTRSALDGLY